MSGYTVEAMKRIRQVLGLQEQENLDRDLIRFDLEAGQTFFSGVKISDALFDDEQMILTVFHSYGQRCAVIPYADVRLISLAFAGPGELVRP